MDFFHVLLEIAFLLQVIGVWEKNFSLTDPPTSQSLDELEKEFVNAACFQVKYGPSSLNDYTKWRVCVWNMKFLKLGVIFPPLILNCVVQVEMIAKEYLKSLTDPEKEEEDITAETPVKEIGVGLSIQFNNNSAVCHVLGSN